MSDNEDDYGDELDAIAKQTEAKIEKHEE